MEIWIGSMEDGRSSWDDWKDKTPMERFLAANKIREEYHNGRAGLNAGLERFAEIVDMPEY